MRFNEWKDMIPRRNLSTAVWIFCPGHVGVAGNEWADVLAVKAGVGEPLSRDSPSVMATFTEWFNNNLVVVPSYTIDIVIEKGLHINAD